MIQAGRKKIGRFQCGHKIGGHIGRQLRRKHREINRLTSREINRENSTGKKGETEGQKRAR